MTRRWPGMVVVGAASALAVAGCRGREAPARHDPGPGLSCTMWLPTPWMLRVPPGGQRVLLAEREPPAWSPEEAKREVVGVLRPEPSFDQAVSAVKAEAVEALRRGEGALIDSEVDRHGIFFEYWWGDGPSGCAPDEHCPVPGMKRHLRFVSQQGERVVLVSADLPFGEEGFTLREVFRTFRCTVSDGG